MYAARGKDCSVSIRKAIAATGCSLFIPLQIYNLKLPHILSSRDVSGIAMFLTRVWPGAAGAHQRRAPHNHAAASPAHLCSARDADSLWQAAAGQHSTGRGASPFQCQRQIRSTGELPALINALLGATQGLNKVGSEVIFLK